MEKQITEITDISAWLEQDCVLLNIWKYFGQSNFKRLESLGCPLLFLGAVMMCPDRTPGWDILSSRHRSSGWHEREVWPLCFSKWGLEKGQKHSAPLRKYSFLSTQRYFFGPSCCHWTMVFYIMGFSLTLYYGEAQKYTKVDRTIQLTSICLKTVLATINQ